MKSHVWEHSHSTPWGERVSNDDGDCLVVDPALVAAVGRVYRGSLFVNGEVISSVLRAY